MSRSDLLLSLCEQWRHLSETEGQAIRAADWERVSACQAAKQALQVRVTEAIKILPASPGDGATSPTRTVLQLHDVSNQLVALESRNREWLQAQKRSAETRVTELRQTSRNLRKVLRAYGSSTAPLWHSFS